MTGKDIPDIILSGTAPHCTSLLFIDTIIEAGCLQVACTQILSKLLVQCPTYFLQSPDTCKSMGLD